MKNSLSLFALATAGAFAFTSLAIAEDAKPSAPGGEKRPGGRGNPEERLKMMTEKLGLTTEQQDKIKAIFAKNGPELRELMAKGRDNLSEADKAKARELMKGQMEEIAGVLTPEQKAKWKEERDARGPGAGERGKGAK